MKKVRCFLAVMALVATLGGFSLQGMAAGAMANAASTHHVTASFTTGKSVALKPFGPCPGGGMDDC